MEAVAVAQQENKWLETERYWVQIRSSYNMPFIEDDRYLLYNEKSTIALRILYKNIMKIEIAELTGMVKNWTGFFGAKTLSRTTFPMDF